MSNININNSRIDTVLYFWPVKARAHPIAWLVGFHQLPVRFHTDIPFPGTDEWEAFSPKSGLGQLPLLQDEEEFVGQSGTIFRYLVEKHQLYWDETEDELYEVSNDLFTMLVKAHYSKDRTEAMTDIFENKISTYLRFIEKTISGDIISPGPGEISSACILSICESLDAGCTSHYTQCSALLEVLQTHPGIKRSEAVFNEPYLKR